MSNSYTEDHVSGSSLLFANYINFFSVVKTKNMTYLQEAAIVAGFEVPKSPDSSYNNVYPGNEDAARDPPVVPPHLQHTLLHNPASISTSGTLPQPQNVVLNHLYIENREAPRSMVALGFTHRFRSKYVTVVLYKPVQRGSSASI